MHPPTSIGDESEDKCMVYAFNPPHPIPIAPARNIIVSLAMLDTQIEATDNGTPLSLSATTRVIFNVVDVPHSSFHPPVFDDNIQNVDIMETDDVGHMVCLLSSTDDDGDNVWYFIVGEYGSGM